MLDAEQLTDVLRHLRAEDLVASPSGVLGGIHGDIRISDELFALP